MSSDPLLELARELVRMEENSISLSTIVAITGLPLDELDLVRQSEEYKRAQVEFVAKRAKSVVRARERRDAIVAQALANVEATLHENVTDGDFALRALLTMQKLSKDAAQEQDKMRDIKSNEGVVTMQIPEHLFAGMKAVSAARLQDQVAHAAGQSKEVGMVGAEMLRKFMGMQDGKTIDGVIAAPLKTEQLTDFQALL